MELIHPIYLDVPMMVSFLAALKDGVSYESEITEKAVSTREREGEGSGSAKLPGIAGLFGLGFDLSGRLKQRSTGEEGTESKVIRKHTEASLFNLLRHSLHESHRLQIIESSSELTELRPHDLFEIRGEMLGNPLERLVDLISAFVGFLGLDLDDEAPTGGGQRRNRSNQQVPAELRQMRQEFSTEYLMMFRSMKKDVEKGRVVDLLLRSDSGVQAVVTLTREFLPQHAEELLLGGQFTVIGKAAAVLATSGSINLARRTVFGAFGGDGTQGIISSFQTGQDSGIDFGNTRLVIEAPAVQVIPLAVFV
ncbi:hypothetical protein ND748_05290 [Frankia sp. AiPs1]|uniref:DUF6414 family protein n=1 Tax=Frankia sp. AiPs1 TaxID=573493 RepID=UPI002042F6EF|nr:hypothetical protein [Frankia sp. AiPs1]MCM3921092.1 hypothetical protein [Frankia sp. AiPs1]